MVKSSRLGLGKSHSSLNLAGWLAFQITFLSALVFKV